MDALRASYGSSEDSSSDSDHSPPNHLNSLLASSVTTEKQRASAQVTPELLLPPPPIYLTDPANSFGSNLCLQVGQTSRVRHFPHVEGNYALHVFIPVHIPTAAKSEIAHFLKRLSPRVPKLHVVDADIPLNSLQNDEKGLEQALLGREFHVSLGRTVPIRVHQIDSVVNMLRQKLQTLKSGFWIDFNKWEVFVNDDRTRTFLSIEVTTGGLAEITSQIRAVDVVYKLHGLPEFYKDPRPHISLAWGLGDISESLKRSLGEQLNKNVNTGGSSLRRIFTVKYAGVVCKIGKKTYKIS